MFEVIEAMPRYSLIYRVDYPHKLTVHCGERLRGRVSEFQARHGHLGTRFDYAFVVDTNHANGLEIHAITNTACVFVFNQRTCKLVTVLFPRPRQIERYYADGHAPKKLLDHAREYQRKGMNKL